MNLTFCGYKITNCVDNELQHFFGQARVNANPEGSLCNDVSVLQIADHSEIDVLISRLPHQVATEEQASANLQAIQVLDELIPREAKASL
jgi:hypothetical protein